MSIPQVDSYVNDASVFVVIGFSGLGTGLCLVVAPICWSLYRRKLLGRVGRYVANSIILMPYIAVILLFLFYRE